MQTTRERRRKEPPRRPAASPPPSPRRRADADDAPRHAGRPAGQTGDRTRERLIQKGLEAFAALGFAGTSVREIARRSRIRVSSLYHYFASKDALYQAVQERVQEQLRELMLGVMGEGLDLRAQAREMVGRLFDFYRENPAYVQLGHRIHLEGVGATESYRRVPDPWLGRMEGLMKPAELPGGCTIEQPVCLEVRDSGPGIPAELRDRLFQPFVTGRIGGTGLGLAIVQRAVEAHRGVVLVDSGPEKGTTFTIFFPARRGAEEAA